MRTGVTNWHPLEALAEMNQERTQGLPRPGEDRDGPDGPKPSFPDLPVHRRPEGQPSPKVVSSKLLGRERGTAIGERLQELTLVLGERSAIVQAIGVHGAGSFGLSRDLRSQIPAVVGRVSQ